MKKTQAMINKEQYLREGKTIPICANIGCNKNVVVRDWKYYSFKHQCSDCTKRQQNNLPPKAGITYLKKTFCENRDGRLGFKCPVDISFNLTYSLLHGDHIDGNHENNNAKNIQTLCALCHHYKGKNIGDFNSYIKGRKLS